MPDSRYDGSVAIVGLAGRFPRADNVSEYWENLCAGRDCFTEFTVDQLVASGVPREVAERPEYVRRSPVLEDPAGFDARLFRYSPREAELIDPQQRILLECAWEALEDAGHDPRRFPGLIGIWAGSGVNNYFLKNVLARPGQFEEIADFQAIISNDKDYLASRVAYKLDLRGPAVVVQTACSTSLVAVHLAAQALLTYQCDLALAGGVSLQTPRAPGYLYREGEIFSPDGLCRPFDRHANGTVLGEGCGLVVLRRFEDAVADGNTILAVIRGSAINSDGADRAGYTAPGVTGQAELVAMALAVADVRPDEVGYIEAHGTGTPVGDPIEVAGLFQAFRRGTAERGFCGLGSAKSNIGHLDVAAGIAGLVKTVCALRHRQLPPTLHFTEANPELHLDESPFFVVDRLMDWRPLHGRRIAGVSSFGMGGTNAHIVLEEYPQPRPAAQPCRRWQAIPISAGSPEAVHALSVRIARHLERKPDLGLHDVAWTLATGRAQLRHRRWVVADSVAAAASRLAEPDALYCVEDEASGGTRPVVFVYSGQGTQYQGMGAELYRSEPVFRESMDHCARVLGKVGGHDSLLALLYGSDAGVGAAIDQTAVSQPALFAVGYSLTRLLESFGVRPAAVAGHSIGEYVAACEAGVFTLEEALELVRERGRLMQSMSPGTMIAVPRSEAEVRGMLPGDLEVAVVNGPAISVVSGPAQSLEEFGKKLEGQGITCRRLHTSHAFHSRMMEPAARDFEAFARRVPMKEPHIPLASNLSGGWMADGQATDPSYWANHIRRTVRFGDNLQTIAGSFASCVLVEVGPGNTLCSIARQNRGPVAGLPSVSTMRHPRQQVPDQAYFIRALGALWCNGTDLDPKMVVDGQTASRVPLPGYPFQHERFWLDPETPRGDRSSVGRPRRASRSGADASEKSRQMACQPGPSELNIDTMMSLWRDVLGVTTLRPDDDFFDIGGHSLLAAQFFARMKAKFGINAPLSILFEAPTVAKLLDRLQREEGRQWHALVPMTRGGHIPLVLVHGAEGNVLLYRELAKHLRPDQAVYGLQCRGLDGHGGHRERIEEMAADYVQEIQAAFPSGPLVVGGYCMGGMVALEIAQQLTAIGRDAPLVLPIESYNYRGCGVRPSRWLERYHSAQNLVFHAHNVLAAGRGQRCAFLSRKLSVELARLTAAQQMVKGRVARRLRKDGNLELPHVALSRINDAAYFAYDPRPYPGRIAVLRPRWQFHGYDKQDCGWGVLAPGRVSVEVLPVCPRGMLVEPFVAELARGVRACIDSVADPTAARKSAAAEAPGAIP